MEGNLLLSCLVHHIFESMKKVVAWQAIPSKTLNQLPSGCEFNHVEIHNIVAITENNQPPFSRAKANSTNQNHDEIHTR